LTEFGCASERLAKNAAVSIVANTEKRMARFIPD
jgi:hypothetical protein